MLLSIGANDNQWITILGHRGNNYCKLICKSIERSYYGILEDGSIDKKHSINYKNNGITSTNKAISLRVNSKCKEAKIKNIKDANKMILNASDEEMHLFRGNHTSINGMLGKEITAERLMYCNKELDKKVFEL